MLFPAAAYCRAASGSLLPRLRLTKLDVSTPKRLDAPSSVSMPISREVAAPRYAVWLKVVSKFRNSAGSAGVTGGRFSSSADNRVAANAWGEKARSTDWLAKFRRASKPGTAASAYQVWPRKLTAGAPGRRCRRHSVKASSGACSTPSRSISVHMPAWAPLIEMSRGTIRPSAAAPGGAARWAAGRAGGDDDCAMAAPCTKPNASSAATRGRGSGRIAGRHRTGQGRLTLKACDSKSSKMTVSCASPPATGCGVARSMALRTPGST
jgi:hypothetical protein